MKRSKLTRVPFKKASGRLKKAPLRRSKPSKVSVLKKALWELCKTIIRARYGNTCYTCGAQNLTGSNWQTGHFIASSICGLYLRYDLRNLRPQCYRCNINLSGNGAIFYRKLVEKEGQEYVDGIFADKNRDCGPEKAFIENLIQKYNVLR